jgi:DNA (cytosine-5)-methyltransferase 1
VIQEPDLWHHDHFTRRELLASSCLGALMAGEVVVDLFCGAGGWGEGARELGLKVDYAVNHWDVAIQTHALNNPGCVHHLGDAWKARPRDVVPDGVPVGVLFASAACTTHSRARGSAPISKRVHMLGWCIARWMEEKRPRLVEIENVPEWKDWGPTTLKRDERGRVVLQNGKPVRVQDPARKGEHFRRWWRYCERLGYAMEMQILDAPDYGSGSRRRRLFIKARRDSMPILWPEKTHGNVPKARGFAGAASTGDAGAGVLRGVAGVPDVRLSGGDGPDSEQGTAGAGVTGGNTLLPYVRACDCIDWTDLGSSIFDRKRPLRPKTLARIAEGIRRFVLNDPKPFVLRVTQSEGKGWHVRAADEPMATQTTRQDLAVATPIVTPAGGPRRGPRPVDEPYHTIIGREDCGVAVPILATTGYGERDGQAARVHQVGELLGTCVDGVKQALVSPVVVGAGGSSYAGKPVAVGGPMGTVKCDDRRGVACPVMTYMRHGGGQTGSVGEPLAATTAGGNHAMLVAALLLEYYGNTASAKRPDQSLGAVTTLDRHGLVVCEIDGQQMVIVDILFRMLRPHELAKAMGFRPDYQWPRSRSGKVNQRDTVRLIGNAVSPRQAAANVRASLPAMAVPV